MIPPPGPHGGDGPAVATALGLEPSAVLDLSMSMNPCAPDLGPLVERHLGSLERYPDPRRARNHLAHTLGIDPDRLLLTNGGSEAISLVTSAIGGTVAREPAFALHPRGAGGPRWRTDPDSPSGLLASPGDDADVWDEAFYPLAAGRWRLDRGPATVVGSLTKVFSCPGLRLGYVIAADPDQLRSIAGRQPTWSVNSLALAVLPDLLDLADLAKWRIQIAALRSSLIEVLGRWGVVARPSDSPWVLAHAPGLRDRLAPAGIVVRDCSSFGLPGWVRIAVPDELGLDRLEAALAKAASTRLPRPLGYPSELP